MALTEFDNGKAGHPVTVLDPNGDAGTTAFAAAVVLSNTDGTALTPAASATATADAFGTEYETVAASQTDQMCGTTGAAGDLLAGVLVIPATTSPGAVSIEDGNTNIPVFTGGASSVTGLVPFFIPLGIKSLAGGWEITTGANVSVIAVGNFT